ncbi:DMT family transporter [Planctomicrobium sp. SH527]|uniref:DMT family transporter n=1 Tax=Planctomicrobium sp. SH527 TaxID=3448123 RepID=UPI003F5C149A
MPVWLLMVIAALVAGLIPIQGIVNGRLGIVLGNPLLAALISFLSGTIILVLIYFGMHGSLPRIPTDGSVAWYLYTGGLIGCIYVTAVLMLIPIIGPANVLAASVVGQLIVALLVEHWGLFGLPQHSISGLRIFGAMLLIFGTWMIQRG